MQEQSIVQVLLVGLGGEGEGIPDGIGELIGRPTGMRTLEEDASGQVVGYQREGAADVMVQHGLVGVDGLRGKEGIIPGDNRHCLAASGLDGIVEDSLG